LKFFFNALKFTVIFLAAVTLLVSPAYSEKKIDKKTSKDILDDIQAMYKLINTHIPDTATAGSKADKKSASTKTIVSNNEDEQYESGDILASYPVFLSSKFSFTVDGLVPEGPAGFIDFLMIGGELTTFDTGVIPISSNKNFWSDAVCGI